MENCSFLVSFKNHIAKEKRGKAGNSCIELACFKVNVIFISFFGGCLLKMDKDNFNDDIYQGFSCKNIALGIGCSDSV